MTCNQQDCELEGKFEFTWPGKDKAFICEEHVDKLQSVANAMGMYLQVIPVVNMDG